MSNDARLEIRLPSEMLRNLELRAEEEDRSISSLVRLAVHSYFQAIKAKEG